MDKPLMTVGCTEIKKVNTESFNQVIRELKQITPETMALNYKDMYIVIERIIERLEDCKKGK